MDLEQRTAILDREIAAYVKRGYHLTARTPTTAQLIKPKKFSFLWALLWFCAFGIGLLVYLFYYAAKRDDSIYLEVTATGSLKRIKH